jgi:photosynthetic reaction center cytochrome c subunit
MALSLDKIGVVCCILTDMRYLATALLLSALALCAQDAPKQGGGRGGPPKNLKVLKPEEVRPVMGLMMASLGQRCNFCHVQGDNASDENPKKLIARKMMEMTNTINANFPDGKAHVSCYTCHRGKNIPDLTPPPAQ